jgi:predicted ATP-dependent endonuclease of OLD family
MIIKSIYVKNFRSILDETLKCEDLIALVGANGAGKSALLRAIDLFYNPVPRIDADDFYNGESDQELVITVTFTGLNEEAKRLFSSYIQGNDLTVERVFTWEGGKASWKYHGATLQNPLFQPIRDGLGIKDRGRTAKDAYDLLRARPGYESLPVWSNLTAAPENLKKWEAEHPEQCERQRDDGQFFGFKEVAQGYLGKFTKFLFIPAVRDASEDSIEGRTVFSNLMDLVVRSVIAKKAAFLNLKEETQNKYKEIMDPANLTELNTLAERMTKTLDTFVPNTKVNLEWLKTGDVDFPPPQANVKLEEDGYSSTIIRTGHGLQRAFIITMLQYLAIAQATPMTPPVQENQGHPETVQEPKLPDLVIAIEEPELYQHPNRQRHLAKILLQLATGKTPGVADKTQIIYATHSPLFVGIDRINQIRLLRKYPNEGGKPRVTKIISTDIDRVAETVWIADGAKGEKYTGVTLLPRLLAIMTPWMSEGFFADVAVLVEGEDDRAAILGAAKATKGIELESEGFSVIPCGGKTSLDRPATIFRQLGIPVYIIWDSDKEDPEANPEHNRRLLRLMNQREEDWPSKIGDNFASFENKLETTLSTEIGSEYFEDCLTECRNEFCIPKKTHAIKNPAVIATIIQKAQEEGRTSITINTIIEKIIALKK